MRRFFEGDFHVVTEIVAAVRLAWVLARAAEKLVKDTSATEHFTENFKGIVKAASQAGAFVKGSMAVLIVGRAFLRVIQDFVGFAQFLELFFGSLIAGVLVGVKFDGQFAVGLFDFLVACVPFHPQDFVIVAFSHGLTRKN